MPLVIFDVDGTLVDSRAHILAAQEQAFAAVGMPAPAPAVALSVVGLSLRESFVALVGADGPVDALAAAFREAWTGLRETPGFVEPLFPGAGEAVVRLHRHPGTVLGIATGKSRIGVDRLLGARGWESLFATIQTADGHPSKPDPSMIRAALRETGYVPGEAVMVGDTTFDVDMAVGAGVRAIGVSWGYHAPAMLTAHGADTVVDTFDELFAALGIDHI